MPSTILSDNGVSSGTAGVKTTGSNDGQLALQTTTAGGTATTALTIDTSQNVGIGTSSPLATAMLEVSRSTTVIPTATVTADAQVVGWRSRRTGGSFPREYYIGIRENSTALDFYDNTANALSARIDSSGNFSFNSGYGSAATAYGCRAWVNFNGATNAIRTSGNVSSITDQGTGIWQISFSNAPPDANYSVQCLTSGQYNSAHTVAYVGAGNQDFASYVPPAPTTSSFYILTCNPSNGGQRAEGTQMMVSVFR
jgi:hypothetical protein